jgi:hypothetical protein
MTISGKNVQQSLASGSPGNRAAVMCAAEKFGKIKNISPIKEPDGRCAADPPGGQG